VESRSGLPQFGLPRFFFMPIFTVQMRLSAPRWVRTSLENRNNIIARWPMLEGQFGRYDVRLYELSRGIDNSQVVPNRPP